MRKKLKESDKEYINDVMAQWRTERLKRRRDEGSNSMQTPCKSVVSMKALSVISLFIIISIFTLSLDGQNSVTDKKEELVT